MVRLSGLIFSIAAALIAVSAAGCGGGSENAAGGTPTAGARTTVRGTPTAGARTADTGTSPGSEPSVPPAESGPGATPAPSDTPSPTSTPAPSNTPEPTETSTPTATPTISQLTFGYSHFGAGTKTDGSFGPFGIVYADSAYAVLVDQNRVQASAFVSVGINERPSASAWLVNQFSVPGEGTTPITAQISTGVNWQGVLAGNGAGGTRAAVRITLSLLDEDDRVLASEEVHVLEHRESVLTLGGFDDIDRADVDMEVALVPGRLYELRLTLTCEASSGFIGVATHCIYGPSETYDDGFVEWGPRTIQFVP